jgi:hypothetical protein
MNYYARVGLGLVLGALAVAALAFFSFAWWIAAAAGALLAILAFLASFFLWTADRPEEGYEQVLFDGPNVVHALVLAAVLVGGAFGTSLFHKGASGPAIPPEELAAVEALNAQQVVLDHALSAYQKAASAFAAKTMDAKSLNSTMKPIATNTTAASDALKGLTVPERLAPLSVALTAQAKALLDALAAEAKCTGGTASACMDARVAAADALAAEKRYVQASGDLGLAA